MAANGSVPRATGTARGRSRRAGWNPCAGVSVRHSHSTARVNILRSTSPMRLARIGVGLWPAACAPIGGLCLAWAGTSLGNEIEELCDVGLGDLRPSRLPQAGFDHLLSIENLVARVVLASSEDARRCSGRSCPLPAGPPAGHPSTASGSCPSSMARRSPWHVRGLRSRSTRASARWSSAVADRRAGSRW